MDTIKMVREGVPTQTKEQWIMNEALIEKIDSYIEYNTQPEKRKPGRPPKEKEKKDTQTYDITKFFKITN